MQIIGILLLALLGQDAPGMNADGYFKFPEGTTWTFDKAEEGENGSVTLTVTAQAEETTTIDSQETQGPESEETKDETLLWYVEKGLLRWAQMGEGKPEPMFTIWKIGARKGDTWTGMGGKPAPFELTAEHMGETSIETPYKNFDKAIHVKMSMEEAKEGMNMVINIYLVDGVGMVKFEGEMGGANEFSLTLREFQKE